MKELFVKKLLSASKPFDATVSRRDPNLLEKVP